MTPRRSFSLLVTTVLTATVLPLAGVAPTASGAVPAGVAPTAAAVRSGPALARAPRIKWHKCPGIGSARVQCAVIAVPLDYDRPGGKKTTIAALRVKASRPATRIGSLFVNPGGPGGSSRDFALQAGQLLGAKVGQRFDVVGIDPRGVGGSAKTLCKGAVPGQPFTRFGYPLGSGQAKQQIKADNNLRLLCKKGANPLVNHASTADVARDMDLVRRALGDKKITYYGVSYGTYLGATYAAMFPKQIRALAVDAVIDPVAWSSGGRQAGVPFTTRINSGRGAFEEFRAALVACEKAGHSRCALAPNAVTKYKRVYAAATRGRLRSNGQRVLPQDVVGTGLNSLYSARDIPGYFSLIADSYASLQARQVAGNGRRTSVVTLRGRTADGWRDQLRLRDQRMRDGLYSWTSPTPRQPLATPARAVSGTADVLFQAVTCSDSRNPSNPAVWERTAKRVDKTQPLFGRLWTWSSSPCARNGIGSAADSYRGPWNRKTSYPLLVVGNSHDPATPISGARKVASLFKGARFVRFAGFGHGAIGTTPCITSVFQNYLVGGKLPKRGKVCQPTRALFP